ncbi:MAG: type VI secretion system baseplate subunit TssF [Pigmentiphaga sp.]|uniref:type VI secretion system baseplate subunit TssF n=1 Tax=Pigmentiphaga sp. TaxID=1977564 RepID=UPI0029B12875|nr:type VI secretion system baseplate subunit TssF [Pigmentiphaga sp.]MDX3905803.1 type VI secretion system baseplate subunit TssF [Pigmentiphaga sp.]
MEQRLLDYYNRELHYIKDLGAEFARAYPKVAARLGMHGVDVADPYVERLLEGFSFLTARIQMKMDAEFPRFSQRLLEIVHPQYLAPTPSMGIVEISPNASEGNLAGGFTLPRGTALRARVAPGEQTPCEFRTGHDVTLWPLRVAEAELTGVPPDLPLAQMGLAGRQASLRAALRLRLETTGGVPLKDLAVDRLEFFLAAQETAASRLLELLLSHTRAVLCHDAARPMRWVRRLPADSLRHEGLDDHQALLPCDARVFQGYRLLQEYFAFPARCLFFSIGGLADALRGTLRQQAADERQAFELTLLLDRHDPELENGVDARHFALHCTPIVNLFVKHADRIPVTPRTHEYHLVVDRTRPLDYEVYSVERVIGHLAAERAQQEFRPFYGSLGSDEEDYGAYYSVRREARLLSDSARRNGPRTGYIGSEVHLSLVDQREAPYPDGLRHLSVEAVCTNRDLALLLPHGSGSDFSLKVSAPVAAIKLVRDLSRPRPPLAENEIAWRLISHLGLNYLALTETDPEEGAQAIRELLQLYAARADAAMRKQIHGVRRVAVEPAYRRLPEAGPIIYGRGVKITLEVDENAFSGGSPYVLGAVLERFLSRHVAINTFTETVLRSLQRGDISHWQPRMGRRTVA